MEHDNYEYKIYGEKDPGPKPTQAKPTPKPTSKPKSTPATDILPVGPILLDCPKYQIHDERDRECFSGNIKKTYHTHVRAHFPRNSGLEFMKFVCGNGPPPPHKVEIYVHQRASNGKYMEARVKNKQTRNKKVTFDKKDRKCGVRAAIDGCDTTSGGLKWSGVVKVQDWEYAIMAWDSVHCPPLEKELIYVPSAGWNSSSNGNTCATDAP